MEEETSADPFVFKLMPDIFPVNREIGWNVQNGSRLLQEAFERINQAGYLPGIWVGHYSRSKASIIDSIRTGLPRSGPISQFDPCGLRITNQSRGVPG
ncbi:MAG: hypothetical protein ACLTSZ_14215 [Lachnospiraceae bacterium]